MSKNKQTGRFVDKGTNLNDVLIKLIDSVYNLVNSGNIVGVILLYFCVQVFYITKKLSAEALDGYVGKIFSLDYFYIFPLGAVLALSVFANYYQARVYRKHIDDLVLTRTQLIHGLKTGELKKLKKHESSGINSMEYSDDC